MVIAIATANIAAASILIEHTEIVINYIAFVALCYKSVKFQASLQQQRLRHGRDSTWLG